MTTNIEGAAAFDMEAEVVVVGGDPPGMTAALGASHLGAKVAMIERTPLRAGPPKRARAVSGS